MVTGALLVIGIKYGRRHAGEINDKTYYLGGEFVRQFQEANSTIICRELTGVDFNTEEGHSAWHDHIHEDVCLPLLHKSVNLLNEILLNCGF